MSTLADRLIGSAVLRARSYEEVEADGHANWQAVGIVILSSLAAAFGTGIKSVGGIAAILMVTLATWVIWVLLTLFIGKQLLPGNQTRADFGQVLRTTGFSSTPGILRALGILPIVGPAIFIAATIWMLLSFVVAVQHALDYDNTRRAFTVCLLGWAIHAVVLFGFVTTAV